MKIDIITGFDGSCPHFPQGVEKRGENSFWVRPGYRAKPGNSEEAPGCGSRLSLQINNGASSALPIELIVDWESDKRTLHHDLGYMRHAGADEWKMIPGMHDGQIVVHDLEIAPGITHFGLYPEYNYEECKKFVTSLAIDQDGFCRARACAMPSYGRVSCKSLFGTHPGLRPPLHGRGTQEITGQAVMIPSLEGYAKRGVGPQSAGKDFCKQLGHIFGRRAASGGPTKKKNYAKILNLPAGHGCNVRVIGQSRERRDLWQITLPSPNPKARTFFIQARDHAYETAGSYCVEGIVDFLRSENEIAIYLRSKFNVYIVPMTNPDGVFNGMSRLTWEQGADLNRVQTIPDPAHDALKRAIDTVKPAVHMNIHNWTDKFTDGLLANEGKIAERIMAFMQPDSAHYKRWMVETQEDWLKANKFTTVPEKSKSWKDYAKEQFNAVGVIFEFPWFGLNTAAMRAKGTRAFLALALAAIAERGL